MNLLLRVIEVHLGDVGGSLCGTYLVSAIKPVPYRYLYQDSNIPYTRESLLKSIEDIWVGDGVTSR